jgi:tRNA A-37 threonylcarbamoyl transferase component Bud32
MANAVSRVLANEVFRALSERPERVRRLALRDGQRYWLKRIEALPLRMRLQKGNARAAFEAERTGLHILGDAGLPVAPIALDGPDFIVLPDIGPTLGVMLETASQAERVEAFKAAGQSLARLHRAGFVHGRPAIRDICWDGTEARFIDLERFSPARRGTVHQALDVVMFVQSVMTATGGPVPELDAALAAYAQAAPAEVLPMVERLALWLGWLRPLARGAHRLRPKSREVAAVLLTLHHLRQRVGQA